MDNVLHEMRFEGLVISVPGPVVRANNVGSVAFDKAKTEMRAVKCISSYERQ